MNFTGIASRWSGRCRRRLAGWPIRRCNSRSFFGGRRGGHARSGQRSVPAAWIERMRGVRAAIRFVPYVLRLWRVAASVDLFHVMANSGWSWHLFAAPAMWVATIRGFPRSSITAAARPRRFCTFGRVVTETMQRAERSSCRRASCRECSRGAGSRARSCRTSSTLSVPAAREQAGRGAAHGRGAQPGADL